MNFGTAQVIAAVIGVALPLVSGWAAKQTASDAVRAVLLLGLSAATSFGTAFVAAVTGGAEFDWKTVLFGVLTTFASAVASHFGFLKPTGLAAKAVALRGFVGK